MRRCGVCVAVEYAECLQYRNIYSFDSVFFKETNQLKNGLVSSIEPPEGVLSAPVCEKSVDQSS